MHSTKAVVVAVAYALLWLALPSIPPFVTFLFVLALFREVFLDSPIPEIRIPPLTNIQDPPSKESRKICAVTGAAGSVGRTIVEELLKENRFDVIRALDIVQPKFNHPKVENIAGNILSDKDLLVAFEGVESVFHVAASIIVREEPHHTATLRRVNVLGTQKVINACVQKRVKKLIYTCSGSAGYSGKFKELNEEIAKNDGVISSYARSKRDAESFGPQGQRPSWIKNYIPQALGNHGRGRSFYDSKYSENTDSDYWR